MTNSNLYSRRKVVGVGAMGLAALSVGELMSCATTQGAAGSWAGGDRIKYFARFGITESMLREVLGAALATGGDRADIFIQHKVRNSLTLEDGAVNRAMSVVQLGAGVRVVKGDQQGYAFTEDLTIDAMRRAAQTAGAVASGPARAAPSSFRADTLPRRYELTMPWEQVQVEQKLPLLRSVNEATFAADARVKKVNVNFADEAGAVLIVDSQGRIAEDIQPMTSLYLSCVAEQNGRRETNGWNVAGRTGFDWYTAERIDRVVKRAVEKTVVLFDAVAPPVGEMPVVLGAGSSGILLHEAIGHGMEADFNRKNVSIFSDKIGKFVAKPFVNIVDDGTQPGARGAINIDDEGNPAGVTHLVENGVLSSYLHDSISAAHYQVEPTGSGRRESYMHAPLPRMRSTYMLPGPHKHEELIASVKKGIYCDAFSNGQVNIGAGDFTFYVTNGMLIEDGKLTRPVKDVNIIGNGPKVLSLIDMVADNLKIDEGGWTCGKSGQSVPVSQGMPSVRVSSITVGGRKA